MNYYKKIFKDMIIDRVFDNGSDFETEKQELIFELQQTFEDS